MHLLGTALGSNLSLIGIVLCGLHYLVVGLKVFL